MASLRPAVVCRVSADLYVVVGVGSGDGPLVKPTHHMRIEKRGSKWYLEVSSGQLASFKTLREARYAASALEADNG